MISHTLQAWATAYGIERRTLETRLVRNGAKILGKNELYEAKEVFNAMYSDKEAAQTRKAMAEAEAQERENRIAEGELANLPAIEKIVWLEGLLPTKLALNSMPASLAAQCNPDNPSLAREVLQNWVRSMLSSIRDPIEKETGE